MKKLIWMLFAIAIFSSGSAYADLIDASFTGDNNISYWNGTAWMAAGNNWESANTLSVNINSPGYIAYFAVSNDRTLPGVGGNPSGLLASFFDTDGTFTETGTNTLLSNSGTFKVLAVSPWINNPPLFPTLPPLSIINPNVNPTTLTGWKKPTDYGANDDKNTEWYEVNGGPVSGINPNAQWIWTSYNDGYYQTENDYSIFEVNLGVNPVCTPEPSTLLLFVFACALLFIFNRKKLLKI